MSVHLGLRLRMCSRSKCTYVCTESDCLYVCKAHAYLCACRWGFAGTSVPNRMCAFTYAHAPVLRCANSHVFTCAPECVPECARECAPNFPCSWRFRFLTSRNLFAVKIRLSFHFAKEFSHSIHNRTAVAQPLYPTKSSPLCERLPVNNLRKS